MTEQLEKSGSAPAAMLAPWLDTAITTLDLLMKCMRHIVRNVREDFGPKVEAELVEQFEAMQRRINSVRGRARAVQKHEFFQVGFALDAQIQKAWVDVRNAAREIHVEEQLAQAHQEMRDYWQWRPKDELLAERDRLTVKLMLVGQSTEARLIQVQLRAIQGARRNRRRP